MKVTPEQAQAIAETAMRYRSANRWFLPGTEQKLIDALLLGDRPQNDIIDDMTNIIEANEIDDPGSDPCDEVNMWAFRAYHPAQII